MAAARPVVIDRLVEMDERPPVPTTDGLPDQAQPSTPAGPSSLAADGRPVGATTQGPHIHERWGESRKLELSYCINFMPGEDAEKTENYQKTIRALHSTMAEWERVTGANFVHIIADDTPDQSPHFTPIDDNLSSAAADCAPGTKAYVSPGGGRRLNQPSSRVAPAGHAHGQLGASGAPAMSQSTSSCRSSSVITVPSPRSQ